MNTLDNVFDEMTSFESLEKAYREARAQKRYRREVLLFSANLDSNLLRIQKQLRDGSYVFGPCKKHWVYVPKKRIVMALPFESRVVQWTVYMTLNPFFDRMMIEDSYACRDVRGSLKAANRLQYWMRYCEAHPDKNWYSVKIDISKYFYRVDHKVLIRILGRRIKDERLMSLLEQIIHSNGEKFGLPRFKSAEEVEDDEWLSDVGMPIGNLTSQMFANIYLNELDQYCKHSLKIHMYERYMDDIALIAESKEKAVFYLKGIEKFANEELKLDLNSKTAVRPLGPMEYVGFMVHPYYLKLRKQTTMRIKRSFRAICDSYFEDELTKEQFYRRVASYSGLIDHCRNKDLKKRLNEIYLLSERNHSKNEEVREDAERNCPVTGRC